MENQNINSLIQAIEALDMRSGLNRQSAFDDARYQAIDLINSHMANKVIVPVDDYDFLIVRVNCYCQKTIGEDYCENDDCTTCRLKRDYKAMLSTQEES